MGLWNTIKGWFNIGGVKVQVQDLNPLIKKTGNQITGKAVLTSKSDKEVASMAYKFIWKKTTGRGNEKETKTYTLAQANTNQPFEIKAGETKTFDFTIPYALEKSLRDMGGVLGFAGKAGAFLAAEKDEYFVTVEAGVKGAAFSPSASVPVQLVD